MKFLLLLTTALLLLSINCQLLNQLVYGSNCTQFGPFKAIPKQGWATNLDRNVDFRLLNGRIIAYKIQWYNGKWSDWYVPDQNDIDWRYSLSGPEGKRENRQMRRVWNYFEDHSFLYILCK